MFNDKRIDFEIVGQAHIGPKNTSGFDLINQRNYLVNDISLAGQREALDKKDGDPDPTLEELEALAAKAVELIGFDNRPFYTGTVEELALKAAVKCLESAHINISEVDMIIGTSNTNGPGYPTLAAEVKSRLATTDSEYAGRTNARCVDVKGACVGGLYALDMAINYLARGKHKCILIIAAEKATELAKKDEWKSSNLFGDGSSSLLVRATTKHHLLAESYGTDPYDNRINYIYNRKDDWKFGQKGKFVHGYIGKAVTNALIKTVTEAKLQKKIKHLFFHQPSKKTGELFYEKVKLHWPQFKGTIHTDLSTGNISSVSVFWLFSKAVEEGKVKRGDTVGFISFGAGMDLGIVFFKY